MDVGELALEEIHKLLLVDEARTLRRSRGFSWIAHRLIQSTDASPVFESHGIKISRIVSRVTVIEDVGVPQTTAEKLVGEVNHLAVGSAYVYLSEDRRVNAIMAHNVVDSTHAATVVSGSYYLESGRLEVFVEITDARTGRVLLDLGPLRGPSARPDSVLAKARDSVVAFMRTQH